MKNALKVARVHLVNAPVTLLMPWTVLLSAFAINLAIFALATSIPPDGRVTGALGSIYIVAFVANIQAVTQMFPFLSGMSLTRRAFLGGTGLFVLAQSVLTGTLLTVLSAIERRTDGWGMSIRFFRPDFMVQDNVFAQVLAYTAPFFCMAVLGLAIGSVFKRWGQNGLYVGALLSLVVLGGLSMLVTWRGWWGDIGRFFTDTPPLALTGGYPLAIAAVLGLCTFAVLRRATP